MAFFLVQQIMDQQAVAFIMGQRLVDQLLPVVFIMVKQLLDQLSVIFIMVQQIIWIQYCGLLHGPEDCGSGNCLALCLD